MPASALALPKAVLQTPHSNRNRRGQMANQRCRKERFARHLWRDSQLGRSAYFCISFWSWERGSAENANGLIHQHLLKGRDLSTVTQEEIDMRMERLENRSRKQPGFKTSNQLVLPCLHRFVIRR